KEIEGALAVVEKVRGSAVGGGLRAAYLASKEDFYKFYVDLLMQMNTAYPGERLDGLALQASERARARSLLDTLSHAGTDVTQGADSRLLERIHALQYQLNQKAFQQNLLANEDQKRALGEQIEALTTDYERAQAELRLASPHLAQLIEPRPLGLAEVQQKVLDAETILLEYSLGKEHSFLWVVSDTTMHSFALPPRAEIDNLARRCYELLTERGKQVQFETPEDRKQRIAAADQEYQVQGERLARILLAPAATLLGNKRLIVVCEAALEYIPFSALPDPASASTDSRAAQPLIAGHEILSLPSASVLSVLRSEVGGRKPAAGTVAVLADPVFDNQDPRAHAQGRQETARSEAQDRGASALKVQPGAARRDKDSKPEPRDANNRQENAEERPARLPFTRAEAEAILGLA